MSVGTGTYRPRLSYKNLGFARFTKLAFHALISLMTDAEVLVLALMQWLGEMSGAVGINSENRHHWPMTRRPAARCFASCAMTCGWRRIGWRANSTTR